MNSLENEMKISVDRLFKLYKADINARQVKLVIRSPNLVSKELETKS